MFAIATIKEVCTFEMLMMIIIADCAIGLSWVRYLLTLIGHVLNCVQNPESMISDTSEPNPEGVYYALFVK